jgi:hypothetical protein
MTGIEPEKSASPQPPAFPASRLTVDCASTADADQWDELVKRHGGSFFCSHAFVAYQSRERNAAPLFLKAMAPGGECVGIAAANCVTPRYWPFSRLCKEAAVNCLPAVAGSDPCLQGQVLAAMERLFARHGIFRIHVAGMDSKNSDTVLTRLGYALRERFEFYLDLSCDSETVWQRLRSEKRTKIRKAIKSGVRTREQNDRAGLEALWGLHTDAMGRRGFNYSASNASETMDAIQHLLLDTGRARLFIDYLEGAPVSAIICGVFGDRAGTFLAGSSLEGNKVGAPAHVYWAMIEQLCKDGFSHINLGGVAAPTNPDGSITDALFVFKKDFGAEAVRQSAGTKVISDRGATVWRTGQWLKRAARLRPGT